MEKEQPAAQPPVQGECSPTAALEAPKEEAGDETKAEETDSSPTRTEGASLTPFGVEERRKLKLEAYVTSGVGKNDVNTNKSSVIAVLP